MRFVAYVFSVLCFSLVTALAEAEKPNFLFILADDLGYGDLGCYGAPDIATPNLDRIASEGIRFTDAYANGAICSPTRIAFLTGRYQQRFGMENALYYQEFGRGLPEGGETIASRLREVGYATGLSGKWHVGYDPGRQPLAQGFDHFFGLLGGNHHYFEHMDRVGVHDLWLGKEEIKREGYSTDLVTKDAIAFIDENRDRPFFLYLSHPAPHFPWQAPTDAEKRVEPKNKSWQEGDRATYVAMVESMDLGIGRVLDRLDELGLTENTLVVFTSDNGGHTYSRNEPLRGEKATLWEGGIRVPCVVRWPKKIAAGRVSAEAIITMDWAATFSALAGESATRDTDDGIDLGPILTDQEGSISRTLFWRSKPGPKRTKVERVRAARDAKWKMIEPEGAEPMLFDVDADPGETTDLAARHPEIIERLRTRLDRWERDVEPR